MTTAALDQVASDSDDGHDPRPVERGPMLRRLLVVLVGVCIGLVGVDRIVLWWDMANGPVTGNESAMPHELLVWTTRPHFERQDLATALDRYGNRNPEIESDAPLDEVRVAGFGPSNVYGAGGCRQPDVWNYELERLASAAASRSVRIVNGGVLAYSALQSCRRASLLLDALEPDLVFVVVGTGAQSLLDPSAARSFVRFGDGPDDFVPEDLAEAWPAFAWPVVGVLHRFFGENSAVYRRHRAKIKPKGGRRADAVDRWLISRAPQSERVQEMLAATLDEIAALHAQCVERNIELRVVVLPEQAADTERAWRRYVSDNQKSGAPPVDTARREPSDVLTELVRARGVKTWDFFDEVASMGPDRAGHTMPDRQHWNKQGHDVFARGLMKRLRAEGLLESLTATRRAAPRTHPFGPSPFQEPGR